MENIVLNEVSDDIGKVIDGKKTAIESIVPYMKQAELMVAVLIKQGKLPKEMKPKRKKKNERQLKYEKWLGMIYQDTEELLKKYHTFKNIECDWFEELASNIDLPITTSPKIIQDTIKNILDFETEGCEKIKRTLAHIREPQLNLRLLEYGLRKLENQSDENDYYIIIKNAFLDDGKKTKKKNDRESLMMRYGIDLTESTYYKRRKGALEALSLYLFGASNKEFATLNMFATIIMPDYDMCDEIEGEL